MKQLRAVLVAAPAALVLACSASGSNVSSGAGGASTATGSGAGASSSQASASATGSTTTTTTSTSASSSSGAVGTIGPNGGTLSTLSFVVVGDTRPANEDDTAGYPTDIITKIWQDVEARSPRPAFAVTTGDYMYASTSGGQSAPQLTKYLTARQIFSNIDFPVIGNHECTGYTDSNCGQGNKDGVTDNYTNFLSMMLKPLGQSLPYYSVDINGTNNAWTAKFIFAACNAWDQTQANWLSSALSKPTTYTFVVNHEGSHTSNAPCNDSSVLPTTLLSLIGQHPLTLHIVGHTHTFEFYSSEREMIVGNGGAPLSGQINYGYVIAQQQPNGTMSFDEYDYMTNAAAASYNLSP